MRSWRSSSIVAIVGLALAVGAAGCPGPQPASEREVVEPVTAGLAASLQAEPRADTVYLTLRVTNPGDAPVELTFPTGQSFEFLVERNGEEVWRWSEGRAFTQAVRQISVEGSATESYEATWVPPADLTGEFRVRGFLTALEDRLEQQSWIRLP
jgi:hypothetical protein